MCTFKTKTNKSLICSVALCCVGLIIILLWNQQMPCLSERLTMWKSGSPAKMMGIQRARLVIYQFYAVATEQSHTISWQSHSDQQPNNSNTLRNSCKRTSAGDSLVTTIYCIMPIQWPLGGSCTAVFEYVCSTHKGRKAGKNCIVGLCCVIQNQTG